MSPALGAAALALLLSAAAPPTPATAPAPPAAPPAPAAPAAAEARQLAAKRSWDELYLRFSAAKAAGYKDADRKLVASALLEASKALGSDLALAVACAEKSAEFSPTVEAWLAAGDANLALKQAAAAAAAYEKAVLLAPTNARALMSRADLAMQEGEPGLAVSLYSKVPAKAPESKAAQEKLAKARLAEQDRAKAQAELDGANRKIVVAATKAQAKEDPGGISYEKVCSESMRALCVLVRKCMPDDPSAAGCDDAVENECAKLEGATRVSRKDLDACVAGIKQASCAQFLGAPKKMAELTPACAAAEKALDQLRDPEGQ